MERLSTLLALEPIGFWASGVFLFDVLVHSIFPRKGLEAVGTAHSMFSRPTSLDMAVIMLLTLDDRSALGAGSFTHDVTWWAANDEMVELRDAHPFL